MRSVKTMHLPSDFRKYLKKYVAFGFEVLANAW